MVISNHDFETLIHDFEKIKYVPKERTFLEIGGFPHYELVISNFLAFFLDPEAEHQFKGMVLQAILNLLKITEELSDVVVETEVANIDILISSSTHVIAIENKIYHHADSNPFSSYVQEVRSRFNAPYHRHHFIVLTPFPEVAKRRQKELASLNYIILTYNDLFSQIRALMGNFSANASNRHWLLLIDLMTTIENLSSSRNFDQASLTFFENNATSLADLLNKMESFRSELRQKVIALHNVLRTEYPTLLSDDKLANRGAYYREKEDLFFDTFFVNVTFPNGALVGCDVTVRIKGWEITVIPRQIGNFDAVSNCLTRSKLTFDKLRDRFLLNSLSIPNGINADLGNVAEVAASIIETLKDCAQKANPTEWVGK